MRRMASASGMQVSVTRFMWRSSSSCSLRGRQIAPVGDALIEVVRHQVEDIFFEIGAGAADGVDFILANHFGKR